MEERSQEQRELSQKLHRLSQRYYDKGQNALCFLVIGSILLVTGILFIFISFKREMNQIVGIATNSLAFYIMLVCGILGAILFAFGLIKFINSQAKRKKVIKEINDMK